MRRLPRRAVALSILAFTLGACGLVGHHAADNGRDLPVLFSPNGEPLSGGPLGHPSCKVALAAWFDRVDTDHDGKITLDEYLADARRQFAAMDLDHDGTLTPAELSRYRAPYAAGAARDEGESVGGAAPQSGREDRAPASPSDLPDPVMAADVNLRNRVTLADFLAYEHHQFDALDRTGSRRIGHADVLRFCGPPP